MIKLDLKRGGWAILSIGRLSFHVTRDGFAIGWTRRFHDYYHPVLRLDW